MSLDDSRDIAINVEGILQQQLNHTVPVLVVLSLQLIEADTHVNTLGVPINLGFFLQKRDHPIDMPLTSAICLW